MAEIAGLTGKHLIIFGVIIAAALIGGIAISSYMAGSTVQQVASTIAATTAAPTVTTPAVTAEEVYAKIALSAGGWQNPYTSGTSMPATIYNKTAAWENGTITFIAFSVTNTGEKDTTISYYISLPDELNDYVSVVYPTDIDHTSVSLPAQSFKTLQFGIKVDNGAALTNGTYTATILVLVPEEDVNVAEGQATSYKLDYSLYVAP